MNETAAGVLRAALEGAMVSEGLHRDRVAEAEREVVKWKGYLAADEQHIAALREALGEPTLAGARWFKVGRVHLIDSTGSASTTALCGLQTAFGSTDLDIRRGPIDGDLCATCLKASETRPYWRD